MRVRHHDNDGCVGELRYLSTAEYADVSQLAFLIRKLTALGDIETVPGLGRHVARHYGPRGEWSLANTFLGHVGAAGEELKAVTSAVVCGGAFLRIQAAMEPGLADDDATSAAVRARVYLHRLAAERSDAERWRQWCAMYRPYDSAAASLTALLIVMASGS